MYQHLDSEGQPLPYAAGKVVCVGRSYRDHVSELNNPLPDQPLFFIKPATSLVSLDQPLVLPIGHGAVHHEVEVALLIGHPLCNAQAKDTLSAIVGVGLALDLTLRDLQDTLKAQGHPWERAKAFDGSCPVTGFVKPESLGELQALDFSLSVNGQLRQSGNTSLMMWSIAELLAQMSQSFTLTPGDIVLTGTPKGVSALTAQDTLELTLHGQYRFHAQIAG